MQQEIAARLYQAFLPRLRPLARAVFFYVGPTRHRDLHQDQRDVQPSERRRPRPARRRRSTNGTGRAIIPPQTSHRHGSGRHTDQDVTDQDVAPVMPVTSAMAGRVWWWDLLTHYAWMGGVITNAALRGMSR